MPFEFDPKKSDGNKEKHGIDFLKAQTLWQDENRLLIPARTEDEERWMIIATWNSRIWTGIYTVRDGNIRIISVRRARKSEEEAYESQGLG